jgi:hypothetical protein
MKADRKGGGGVKEDDRKNKIKSVCLFLYISFPFLTIDQFTLKESVSLFEKYYCTVSYKSA